MGRIRVKRVHEPPVSEDGKRFLVERLWPRGLKREKLALDGWLWDVAPSDGLRRRFRHDPQKGEEFQRRYFAEEAWRPLLETARVAVQCPGRSPQQCRSPQGVPIALLRNGCRIQDARCRIGRARIPAPEPVRRRGPSLVTGKRAHRVCIQQ